MIRRSTLTFLVLAAAVVVTLGCSQPELEEAVGDITAVVEEVVEPGESEPAGEAAADPGESEPACGGIQGLPCEDGQLCDLPAGECQAADLEGVCVDRPEVCPEIFDPVCGCDGSTYSNDCFRLMAGVQKDHDGECATR